jgi:transposase
MVYQNTKDQGMKMYTIRFLLKTTAYDEQVIDKRFHAVSHIHNVLVKHAKRLLCRLRHDRVYRQYREEYATFLKKEELSKPDKQRMKELSRQMNDIRTSIGLTEYAFQSYIKVCAARYRKCLSSQQVQKEASRVWKGVEDVIFGEGKDIHFKKYADFKTICGKSNTNGVKFKKRADGIFCVHWLGLDIRCKMPKTPEDMEYVSQSLNNKISYCEIARAMFPNGWHYYVIVYLHGDAPRRLHRNGIPEDNLTGIDIGTSTVATVSGDMVSLRELAPDCSSYNKEIQELLYRMDVSRRTHNPDKYNPDGTFKKGNRDRWVYTKTYIRNRNLLRSLYRKKSAYIKQSHEELCNILLRDSVNFIVEEMSFKGLQKRSRKTERSNRTTDIVQKDGSVRSVHKYKRKKRFGRSLNNRAPALFLTILERKCSLYGGHLLKADTKKFKASQYDHTTGTCKKAALSEREKQINGRYVQRDLYSAFLLRNSNSTMDAPDREKCNRGFENFLIMQDELIQKMKADGISRKQCFGF